MTGNRKTNFAVTSLSGISPMAMSILKNLYEKKEQSSVLGTMKREPSIKIKQGNTENSQKDQEMYIVIGQAKEKTVFKTVTIQKEYKPRRSPRIHKGSPTQIQKSFSIERAKSKENYEYPPIMKKNIFEATKDDVFHRKTIDFISADEETTHSLQKIPKISTLVTHFPQPDFPPKKKSSPHSKETNKIREIPQAYLIQKPSKIKTVLEKGKDNVSNSLFPSYSQEKILNEKSMPKIKMQEKPEIKPFLQKPVGFIENSGKKKGMLMPIDNELGISKLPSVVQTRIQPMEEIKEVPERKNTSPPRIVSEQIKKTSINYNLVAKSKKKKAEKYNRSLDGESSHPVPSKPKHNNKEMKRDYLLYNLFLGISIVVKPVKKGSAPLKYKFGVGTGNNDKLIDRLLRSKGMDCENFFSKCNLVWTQATSKRTAIASLGVGVEEMDLQDNNTPQKVRAFKIKSPEALEKQIIDLKLFKVSDEKLVKEITLFLQARSKLTVIKAETFAMLNHIKGLKYISRKHLLFGSIRKYCASHQIPLDSVVPQTWVLHGDVFDQELESMIQEKCSSKDGFTNPLIIKPGENSNRGQGITLAYTKEEAIRLCKDVLESRKNTSTVVVQTYISNPLLFLKRKFDIRCYALVHRLPGRLSYYWYTRGYARTCSVEYSLDAKDNLMVHLTNEGVQVKGRTYLT